MFEKLMQISVGLSENAYLSAIKKAFVNSTPVILIGAVALILTNFPAQGYHDFAAALFGENWSEILTDANLTTFNLISIYIGMQIIFNIASTSAVLKENFINPIISTITCLAGSLFLIFPKDAGNFVDTLSAVGLFKIIISSLLCVKIFETAVQAASSRLWKISGEYEDLDARRTVAALFPTFATFVVLIFIKILIRMPIFSYMGDKIMNDYIIGFALKFKNTLGLAVLFVASIHVMWFFGIHGSNMLEPLSQIVYVPNAAENAAMISAGLEPEFIFSHQFFSIFVLMGGAGCTLSLVLAILIFGRNSTMSKFVKTSGIISLFNVNELMIYGLPIMFNPIYLIPFIGVPIIITIISYIAFASGLVPLINNPDVPWTCPIILGGYYSTGSVSGVILQLVNIAVATACYAPFVKIARRFKKRESKKNMEKLMENIRTNSKTGALAIDHDSYEGALAEILASDIQKGLERGEFFLIYQPLVLEDEIVGAEALLRWKHPIFGDISPIIILFLASKYGYLKDITKFIISAAFNQSKIWSDSRDKGNLRVSNDFRLSINMSFDQLYCFDWTSYASELISAYKINPRDIEIEISEEIAFDRSEYNLNMINGLLALGFDLSIDNFGMGYSSLVYLCAFKVSEVKIDGNIINTVFENPKSLDVVRSILELCDNMNIRCVAKMPENIELLELINSLGPVIYQSYFYSKPLTPSEFEEFANNFKGRYNGAPIRLANEAKSGVKNDFKDGE